MLYIPEARLGFVHCPKTGGTFIRDTIIKLGIQCDTTLSHARADDLIAWRPGVKTIFTFVRHPAEWMKSYWAWLMVNGFGGDITIGHDCASMDFNSFVNNVVDRHPGFITELFDSYTRSYEGVETIVYRFPAVLAGLLDVLIRCNVPFDVKKLAGLQMVNDSPSWLYNLANFSPNTYARLMVVERHGISKYNLDIQSCLHRKPR